MKIPKFKKFNEDIVVGGFTTNSPSRYTMGSPIATTGYSMVALAGKNDELGNQVANEARSYEENENPDHTAKGYLNEAKKYVCERLDEACNSKTEGVNEEEKYVFDPQESYNRLKKREEMNIRRYRDAQNRGDNYAIKLYELRIKMDAVDKKKIEIQTAISELDKKYGKDGE